MVTARTVSIVATVVNKATATTAFEVDGDSGTAGLCITGRSCCVSETVSKDGVGREEAVTGARGKECHKL